MAENQNVNKIVYGGVTLLDLTADTVSAEKILAGFTAHDKSGTLISGTCDFDVDSGDATVQVGEVLDGKTAYARGAKLTGTMPDRGGVQLHLAVVDDELVIPDGYHNGDGRASILPVERAKLIGDNILQGITILGVTGTLRPASAVVVQAKAATPAISAQTILPDDGYEYLTQVTVAAIPYTEVDNASGGKTVTIGG